LIFNIAKLKNHGSNRCMKNTAIIIGATGLVGSEILNYCLSDKRIKKVKVFVRKSTGISDSKMEEFVVNFDELNNWRKDLTGDILFSALGTTKKQVGTREAQRLVDYDYQLRIAQTAKINGIKNYVLVSAPSANTKSWFAYTKIKGELERDVMKLSFPKITIIRPGLLKGPRSHTRFVEQNLGKVLSFFPIIPGLEALKPVTGKHVAHACMELSLDDQHGQRILNPKEVLHFL
jgi:uncharacterized protein YbjT (DUF2867 family)